MIQKIFYYLRIYGLKTFTLYSLAEIKARLRMALIHSYTPLGEDIIIDKVLNYRQKGFYVDIGAYDPTRLNNTKRFYLKRWKGINIDPNPESIKKFNRERPRDVNLNIGIATKNGIIDFFRFEPESLSTFSKKIANGYQKQGYRLIETIKIKTRRLDKILTKYCNNQTIDFFSIDTEGFDYEVLKSNDWNKFRPRVICIELPSFKNLRQSNFRRKLPDHTKILLSRLGYKLICKTTSNAIFLLRE